MESHTDITVYRPNQRHELGMFRTWLVMARNVISARELIWQLFKRDFLAAYKKSFIGFAWIAITPLLGIVSWVFLQKTGMLQPGDVGIPYPAYVLIGTSMWGLFMGFYVSASETLTAGKALIMQVNYSHEALLFKQAAQHVAQFVIVFILNLVVLAAYGVVPSWGILVFPLVALPLFFLGAAIGLLVSMFSVVAMDLTRIINMGMGILIWVTPVIYSEKVDNAFVRYVVTHNPLTYLVCSCRDIVIYGRLYNPPVYSACALLSLFLFLLSWRLFFVSEHQIVEKMI